MAYFVSKYKQQAALAVAGATALGVAIILGAYEKFGADLWNFSGRIPMWIGSMKLQFMFPQKIAFGFGIGTFHSYGIAISKQFDVGSIGG